MKSARYTHRSFLILVLLLLMTRALYGNAGTGFFDLGIIFLLALNLIIGWIEALFVRRAFKVDASYGRIILANYTSAIIGIGIIVLISAEVEPLTEINGWLAWTLLFIATVIVEWPFFTWAVNKGKFVFSRSSFKHTFYAQCVSYALLGLLIFVTRTLFRVSDRDIIEATFHVEAYSARDYREDVISFGGGGGSYRGFRISERNKFRRYRATTARDSIVFAALNDEKTRIMLSVVLDSTGRLHSWKERFEQSDSAASEHVISDLNILSRWAREYRKRPRLPRGEGSYIGYSISVDEEYPNKFARYSGTVSKDSIVLVATTIDRTRTIVSAVVDSTGKLHSWKWASEIN